MKTLRKTLIILAITIIAATTTAVWLARRISKRAVPDYNQSYILEGLTDEVHVFRDQYAIPHIYAKNEHDVYFATGFVMAQDRLWQMDLMRRATTGELSEILGKDFIDADYLLRMLDFPGKSKLMYDSLSQDMKTALHAYAQGVNVWIDKAGKNLPPEFAILGYKPKPWEATHCLNLVGYMAWDLAMSWHSEVLLYQIERKIGRQKMEELLPDPALQGTTIFNDSMPLADIPLSNSLTANNILLQNGLHISLASNNWALAGTKNTSGAPMLANDMHLGFMIPGIWYQIHQHVEGKLNVTGLAVPGQPMVICGHNDSIAWGMTNVMIDDMDFYLEKINPKNPNQYQFEGQWKDMDIRLETIRIGKNDSVVKEILFTHRGPVVSSAHKEEQAVLSMRWMGNEYSNEVRSVYLLNRAKNLTDFKDAMRTFISISQNVAYADQNGNIGLFTCAGIAKRRGNPALVFPGETVKYDWNGLVPFDSLPAIVNPASGVVASANCRTVGVTYPWYISAWFEIPSRQERINEVLASKAQLSLQDLIALQNDHLSPLARSITPAILAEVKKIKKANDLHLKALNLLEAWDYQMEADRPEACLFEVFYNEFARLTFEDDLPKALFEPLIDNKILLRQYMNRVFASKTSLFLDRTESPQQEDFHDIVVMAFEAALDKLHHELGTDINAWKWGDIHTLTLEHPMGKVNILNRIFRLNRGPYPVNGSFHTVSPYACDPGFPFKSVHGASHRHLFTLANWDSSLTVIPTGTCGVPASPHYCDQTLLYLGGEYHADPFSSEFIEQNTKYHTTLKPAK